MWSSGKTCKACRDIGDHLLPPTLILINAMLLVMSLKRCKFCSMDFHFPKPLYLENRAKHTHLKFGTLRWYDRDKPFSLFRSPFNLFLDVYSFWFNFWGTVLSSFFDFKCLKVEGEDTRLCESCSDLDFYLKPDEEYGQVWDVKKVVENSHLNLAQQKVYLKYGLISPREAVERIKLDNTWQDSEYPTLTLEDLNYRPLKLIDAIPTGFYLVPVIILGLMILDGSWFIKFLGISGIGGIFYWLHQSDQNTQIRAERWMPPEED